MEKLDFYKKYLEESFKKYHSDERMISLYKKLPLSRYYTFKFCFENIDSKKDYKILELGTSRSFVDGTYDGVNSDNTKYWEPDNPEKWDWSAGFFTYVFGEKISGTNKKLDTLDICKKHIERCKIMTKNFCKNINYHVSDSREFLKKCSKYDLIYLDTGDMYPIEFTAKLQLEEAKLIVERNLLNEGGLILIDDVRNPAPKITENEKSDYGKAKYSIDYFLKNNFTIIMDEYQVILKKN